MYSPQHEFLIGIDSDGCAFDTMELKHKECFIPNTVLHWNLQGISKYVRETFEFVNLYSKSRGINRFPALIETFERLAQRPQVQARGRKPELPQSLIDWAKTETKLGNPALKLAVEKTGDPGLAQTLKWSQAVNETIDKIVADGVPPFPLVRESLQAVQGKADVLVVSATPQDALLREWENQDLRPLVAGICGQEAGTKKESLQKARKLGKYPPQRILMVGDAPGDYKAALANEALFFPINPGAEEKSWEQFFHEGLDRFFHETFAGQYQEALLESFHEYLPSDPPWTKNGTK